MRIFLCLPHTSSIHHGPQGVRGIGLVAALAWCTLRAMIPRFLAPLVLALSCCYSPIDSDGADETGWAPAYETGAVVAEQCAEECPVGSTGCECSAQLSCDMGLVCKQGFCGPCPAGQIDCPCEAGAVCDDPWVCVDGMCY